MERINNQSGRMIVSVAMATYNGARFLRQQLDSLYAQTRVPDEVVVCDDCSTDGTAEILEEYRKKYGLIYHVNDKNLGVNANFFKAISLCHGDYISICDQDDIWLPEKIEKSLHKIRSIENDAPAVVSTKCNHIDANGDIVSKENKLKDSYGYPGTLLYPQETCQGCSLLFNRKLADYVLDHYSKSPFSSDYIIYDAYIAYTGAMIGNKYDIGEVLFLYRHHTSNVIGKIQGKMSFKEHLMVQSRFRGFIPDYRFQSIKRIYTIVKADINRKEIHAIIEKLVKIDNYGFSLQGFGVILTIKELSIFDRFSIIINSVIVNVLRKALNV